MAVRVGMVVLLVLTAGGAPGRAGADDFPSVKVTKDGPKGPIPFNKPFYLTGEVEEDVDRVQAILVRKGSRFIWGHTGPTCDAVNPIFKPVMAGKVPAGVYLPSQLLPRGVYADLGSVDRVLVTAASIPQASDPDGGGQVNDHKDPAPPAAPAASAAPSAGKASPPKTDKKTADRVKSSDENKDAPGKKTFNMLVPATPTDDFFLPGNNYCVLVYKHRSADVAPLLKLMEDRSKCEEALKLIQAKTKPIGVQDESLCRFAFAAAVRDRVQRRQMQAASLIFKNADDEQKWAVLQAEEAYKNYQARQVQADALDVALRKFDGLSVADDGVAPLLAKLVRWRDMLNGFGPVSTTAVLADRAHVYVTRKLPPKKPEKDAPPSLKPNETIATSELRVPNEPAVTFEDLLELVYGRIRLDGDYVRVEGVKAKLTGPPLDHKRGGGRAYRERLDALDAVVKRLAGKSVGSEACSSEDLHDQAIEQCFGWWLTSVKLGSSLGASLVESLVGAIEALEKSPASDGEGAAGAVASIMMDVEAETPATLPIPLRDGEMTARQWAGSYLTPVTGAALVPWLVHSTLIAKPYAGFQMHFSPSPVDDPLWTHGRSDWRRAFAFEIGAMTTTSAFGSDNRFTGLGKGSFPPVFASFDVHLIPYTSVGIGGVLFEARSTTLAQQDARVVAVPVLTLNVQANLPDVIHGLANGWASRFITTDGGKSDKGEQK